MKTILVTGGAGYIGSQLTKLLYNNYKIVVVDNLSSGNISSVKWGKFYKADLKNKNDLDKIFKKHKFFAVMHLAAMALVEESVEKPDQYYENNVVGTKNLLDCMIKHNVKNIVFSSTCAVYGYNDKGKINEQKYLDPINPYGETKRVCEEIMKNYSMIGKINYVALRYFNAAGADIDNEIGEKRKIETHLLPIILKSVKNKKTIQIYGKNYPTPDKTCVRDYLHVMDIARAHIESLKYLKKIKKSNVFNLGTGKGISVLEMIKMTDKIIGSKINYKYAKRRVGDPSFLVADSRKIKKILKFKYKYSDPNTIIRTAWNWFKKN